MLSKTNKLLTLIFVCILSISFTSAFLISDQGTDVKDVATGNLTELANLTIFIYEESSGGSPIFQEDFNDGIVNGSWNVMIDPDLQYGVNYWKDYEINGESLDFDGNDRLEFQSSVGKINTVSFINLSLISSCPAGSSIRLVYENGSVECETDDTGSGSYNDSWINTTIDSKILTNNNSVNNYISLNNNSIINWITATFASLATVVNAIGNWSADKANYYNITQVNAINSSTTNYINSNNQSLTNAINAIAGGGEPLWTGNITIFNSSWLTTYNATTNASITNYINLNNNSLNSYISSNNNSINSYLIYVNSTLMSIINNGSYFNSASTDTFIANYSAFLTHMNWTTAMNGTLMQTSQWNATNTSYMLITQWNATNTSYLVTETDPNAYNGTLVAISILNNGSYLNAASTDTFIANYSAFLTHMNWTTAMNGTLMKTSQWNATNTSYIPYTGANQNVDLGNNNLTVNGTTLFVNANNSRVGIGTTNPIAKLQIGDGTPALTPSVDNSLAIITTGSTNGYAPFSIKTAVGSMVFTNAGNVGIGTSSPQEKLHVNGNILANGTINATTDVCIQGGNCLSNVTGGAGGEPNWNTNYSNVAQLNQSNNFGAYNQSFDNQTLVIDANIHKVGINGPADTEFNFYDLYVHGGILADSYTVKNGTSLSLNSLYAPNGLAFDYWNGTHVLTALKWNNSGYVGINTTYPNATLDVNGDINLPAGRSINFNNQINGFLSTNAFYTAEEFFNFKSWNGTAIQTNMVVNSTSGYVGIGTTNPTTSLQIAPGTLHGLAVGGDYPSWMGDNGIYATGVIKGGGYLIDDNGNVNWGTSRTGIKGYSALNDYYLIFKTNDTERMRLNKIGYLGINTSYPNATLQVVGNILANGTINATGDICIEGGNCLSNAGAGGEPNWNANYSNVVNNNNLDYRNLVVTDDSGNIAHRDLTNPISFTDAPFGQYVIYNPSFNNLFYSADKKFNVTSTGFSNFYAPSLFDGNYDQYYTQITTNNTNATININLLDKGEYGNGDLTYSEGWIYIHFYYNANTNNVSARLKTKNEGETYIWRENVTGVDISSKGSSHVMKIPLGAFNYRCSDIEITIDSGTLNPASDPPNMVAVSEIEFIVDRSADSHVQSLVSKTLDNSLYGNTSWKDSNNNLTAQIDPSTGDAYFSGTASATQFSTQWIDINSNQINSLASELAINYGYSANTNIFYGLSPASALFVNGTSGNVGIGTTNPQDTFVVSKTVGATTGETRFGGENGRTLTAYSNGTLANFDFMALSTFFASNFILDSKKVISLYGNNDSNNQDYVQIYVSDNDHLSFDINGTKQLSIDNNGSVGIGTDSPSATLDVNGSAAINGTLNMTSNNITAVNCITFASGGKICST